MCVGATLTMSSGSTMEMVGKVESLPRLIFSMPPDLLITAHWSASVPVPAVVGMASKRCCWIFRINAAAGTGLHVIPAFAHVGGQKSDGFGCIDSGAAAKCNDKVDSFFTGDFCSLVNLIGFRVGGYVIETTVETSCLARRA